jgi:hypothetical protein
LAYMIQGSNVAPGPLVSTDLLNLLPLGPHDCRVAANLRQASLLVYRDN